MMRVWLTGTAYLVAVVAAGFVLRTLVLVPLLGPLGAALFELPVIPTLAWMVCIRILRSWPRLSTSAAARMGAVAFSLLMLVEASPSDLLAGRSLTEHLSLYAQLPHQVGLAGQLAFALFPWIQARRFFSDRYSFCHAVYMAWVSSLRA
jgi:hypothetical protein